MAFLTAALAFAVTMLILAMSTSVLVETIHRCIGLREKGFRLMIGHIYDRVIGPLVAGNGLDAAALKQTFVDLMTVNRAPAGAAGAPPQDTPGTKDLAANTEALDDKLLGRIWSGRRLDGLSAANFMSRLGGSDFGGAIDAAADAENVLVSDIAAKFEQFGAEASEFFERRARLLAVLVALGVAYLCYVNPFELISFYLDPANAKVTEQIANMAPEGMLNFEAAQKNVEAKKGDLKHEEDGLASAKPEDQADAS